MLATLLNFLIETVGSVITMALLARFYMQWARAPFHNPVGQFVVALTDWAVRPARRLLPSFRGLDTPSLALAWGFQAMAWALTLGLSWGGILLVQGWGPLAGMIAGLALVETLKLATHLIFGVIVVSILFAWINPFAPLAPVFRALAEPVLRPFRRLIPPIGGVDLSPMVPVFLIQAAQMLLAMARHQLLL